MKIASYDTTIGPPSSQMFHSWSAVAQFTNNKAVIFDETCGVYFLQILNMPLTKAEAKGSTEKEGVV